MSTPSTPDEPERQQPETAQQPPVDTAPAGPPTAGQPQLGPPPAQPYLGQPYPGSYANPFVPTVREPWINPAKRRTASWLAALLAIVLLGIGFVVGAVAAHHRDGIQHSRIEPQFGQGQGRGKQVLPGRGNGRFVRPGGGANLPGRPGPLNRPATRPTPSQTPSSSHS
jgi:hypothetical protein